MSGDRSKVFNNNGLSLISYEQIGTIDSAADIENVISSFLTPEGSYFVTDFIITNDDDIHFNVKKLDDILAENNLSREIWENAFRLTMTEEFKYRLGSRVIELFWDYKGRDFSTICVLYSDADEVVHLLWDNILSNIIYPGEPEISSETTDIEWSAPLSKTRAEGGQGGSIQENINFYKAFYDDYSNLAAYVEYSIVVRGQYMGAAKIITGESSASAGISKKYNWSAGCEIVREEITSERCLYAYGWGVKHSLLGMGSVNISYGGTGAGFTINNADESGRGSETISSSDLS